MQIKKILYASHFEKAFRKLPTEIKKLAITKERIFRENCFDERLRTHKLKGELQDYWDFSINYSYRVLFKFHREHEVGFIDVGDHEIYKKI